MSHAGNIGPLASYNSLADEHLAHYYSNPRIRRHLLRAGLITRDGCIVDELSYRESVARREHQDHVKNLLAQSIIDKALDMERRRQEKIKKKLEELCRLETVKRVKDGKARRGDEDFLTLLTPRMMPTPPVTPSKRENSRRQRTGSGVSNDSQELHDSLMGSPYTMSPSPNGRFPAFLSSSSDMGHLRRVHSSPPAFKRKKKRPKTAPALSKTEPLLFKRTQTQSLAKVTLRYLGSSLHLEGSLENEGADITVIQQHGGGSSLCVFRGPVAPRSNFEFTSKRSRGAPFGLTIYVDGMLLSRLSTCCEYKYKPGHLLGGKQSHFQLIHVSAAAPCYRCQAEAELNTPTHWNLKQPKKAKSAEPLAREDANLSEPVAASISNSSGEEEEAESEVDVNEVLRRYQESRDDDNSAVGIGVEVTNAVSVPPSLGPTPSPSLHTFNNRSKLPVPVISVQLATPQPSEYEESESGDEEVPLPSPSVAISQEQDQQRSTENQDEGFGYSSDKEEEDEDYRQKRLVSSTQRRASNNRQLSVSSSSTSSSSQSDGGSGGDKNDDEGETKIVQLKDDEEAYGESDFEEEEEEKDEKEEVKEEEEEVKEEEVKEEEEEVKEEEVKEEEEEVKEEEVKEEEEEVKEEEVKEEEEEIKEEEEEVKEEEEEVKEEEEEVMDEEEEEVMDEEEEVKDEEEEVKDKEEEVKDEEEEVKDEEEEVKDEEEEVKDEEEEVKDEEEEVKDEEEEVKKEEVKDEEEGEKQEEKDEEEKSSLSEEVVSEEQRDSSDLGNATVVKESVTKDEEQDEEVQSGDIETTPTEENVQEGGKVAESTEYELQQDDQPPALPVAMHEGDDIHTDPVAEVGDNPSPTASERSHDMAVDEVFEAVGEELHQQAESRDQSREKGETPVTATEAGHDTQLEDNLTEKQADTEQDVSSQHNRGEEEETIGQEMAEKKVDATEQKEEQGAGNEATTETVETQDDSVETTDGRVGVVAQEDEASGTRTSGTEGTQDDQVEKTSEDVLASVRKPVEDIRDDKHEADASSDPKEVQEPQQEQASEEVSDRQAKSPLTKESAGLHLQVEQERLVKSESSLPQISLRRASDFNTGSNVNIEAINADQTQLSNRAAMDASSAEQQEIPIKAPLLTMMSAKRLLKQSTSGTSLLLSDDETAAPQDEAIFSESDIGDSILDDIPAMLPGSDDSKEASPVDGLEEGNALTSGAEMNGLTGESSVGHGPTVSKRALTEPVAPMLEGKTAVELSNVALTQEQVSEIAAVLEKPETVMNTVSLRNSAIDDTAISALTDAIGSNKAQVQMLNLNLNNVTPEGAKQIADNALRSNTSLQYLLLHGNPIGDDGFRCIVDALVEPITQKDSVKGETSGDTPVGSNNSQQEKKHRRKRRQSSASSSSSSSSSSDSSDEEGRMEKRDPKRDALPDVSPSQSTYNTSLTCLDVGDCKLTDESAPHIARLLHSNHTLTELNLSANRFTATGWREIARALQDNHSLSSLRLDYCSLEDAGLVELCDALAHNSSLKSLDLEGNKITGKGASVLAEALKVNKSLVDVTLMPGNTIEDTILDSIKALLRDRRIEDK